MGKTWIVRVSGCILGLGINVAWAAQTAASAPPVVATAVASGVSVPVRLIPATPEHDGSNDPVMRGNANPLAPKRRLKYETIPWGEPDALIGNTLRLPAVMPPTIQNFEGISNKSNSTLFAGYFYPPDTVGDVGPNHYVQSVNAGIVQIWNKSGAILAAPFKISALFSTLTGSVCLGDDGDPIVLYDHLADRWLISQFAFNSSTDGNYHQCIAISKTGDPTGQYYAYDFAMPNNKFNDYPHFGVWPDGYYMADNQFVLGNSWGGGGAFAFERSRMLAGDPTARYIYFDTAVIDPTLYIGGQLPADLDGPPPPMGTPNIFAMFDANEYDAAATDSIRMWAFQTDWTTPANSTFTEIPKVNVAAFDPTTANSRNIIPQPGAAANQYLDPISDRLMHRLQYRNFGTHESLVVTHTVDASGDPSAAVFKAGIRYYELRRTGGGNWTVHEQGTHSPDAQHRWMGSAAVDGTGNLAVGFTRSGGSAGQFPSVTYAARLATDPPNSLAQGEADIVTGSGIQTGTAGRWGDYSAISVDPVNDCTFWFTSEYYSSTPPSTCDTQICWQTRVGSFQMPGCVAAAAPGTISGTVTIAGGGPAEGAIVTAGNGYVGVTDASGDYSISIPPGSYDMSATKAGYTPDSANGVVAVSSNTTDRDFVLIPEPVLIKGTVVFNDNIPGGNNNGRLDVDECAFITLPIQNTGIASATGVNATLTPITAQIAAPVGSASYADIAPATTVQPAAPFRIQSSPSYVPQGPAQFGAQLNATEGAWATTFSVPSGVAANAPTAFATANGLNTAIPDNNAAGINVTIPVTGLTTAVSKITVSVRLTHAWVGDLSARLIAPNATSVRLFERIGTGTFGNSADNLGADCPAGANDFILDDASATLVDTAANTNNVSGTFRPTQALSTFQGMSAAAANGSWTFNISDNASGDLGNVQCVTVFIDGYAAGTSVGCSTIDTGPAIAANDTLSVNEDASATTVPVTSNDTADPDNGEKVVTSVGAATHGTTALDAGVVTYLPSADYCGADSFGYVLNSTPAITATVDVTVACVNDAPTAPGTLADVATLVAAPMISIDAAAAFADVDNVTLTYAATGLPTGVTIDASSGVISGTPAAGTVGMHNVTVTASDAEPLSASKSFDLEVLAVDIFGDGFEN